MKKKVLIISTHPDDETIGCGGTILKMIDSGYRVDWLICTNIKKEYGFSQELIERRNSEIKRVSEEYKFSSIYDLKLNPMKLDIYSELEIIEMISDVILKSKPEIVFMPFYNDVHSDHKKIFSCSLSCTKAFRHCYIKKIYMMEIVSETDFGNPYACNVFSPNYFVNIEKYIDKKIDIMKIYKSEIMKSPFPRSIENIRNIAAYRGSLINADFAESFMVIKDIWD